MGIIDDTVKMQEKMPDDDGRCAVCGGLLSVIYPSKRSDKGAFYTCKDETCKNYRKFIRGLE